MCQSCEEIDKKIEHYRRLLRSITDDETVGTINRLIAKLYAERVLRHQNEGP
jgi:hypothetical protein